MNETCLTVRCYSSYTYAERPVSFVWQGTNHTILSIEDAWIEPDRRHFLIRSENNQLFHLCYDETKDCWSLMTEK